MNGFRTGEESACLFNLLCSALGKILRGSNKDVKDEQCGSSNGLVRTIVEVTPFPRVLLLMLATLRQVFTVSLRV